MDQKESGPCRNEFGYQVRTQSYLAAQHEAFKGQLSILSFTELPALNSNHS